MKLLATRIKSGAEQSNVHEYEIKKGGGILKKGGLISVTYKEETDAATGLKTRVSPPEVSTKAKRRSVSLGVGIGTTAKSTLPIISEGIGIPYVAELRLGGKTKFEGHFNENEISFGNTGITHPSTEARVAEFQSHLQSIAGASGGQITSIKCEAKDTLALNFGVKFTSTSRTSDSTSTSTFPISKA